MATRDDLIEAIRSMDQMSDEEWNPQPVVEFVVDWLEHTTDRLVTGYVADVLVDAWHEEMGL